MPSFAATRTGSCGRSRPSARREGDLSFLANRRYLRDPAPRARARSSSDPETLTNPLPPFSSPNPSLGYARAATLMSDLPAVEAGIHPNAVVDPGADVSPEASIGPLAVIGSGARVGARARIGPGSVLGPNAAVGEESRLVANVTICRGVRIGARCILHPASSSERTVSVSPTTGESGSRSRSSGASDWATTSRSAPTRPSIGVPSRTP